MILINKLKCYSQLYSRREDTRKLSVSFENEYDMNTELDLSYCTIWMNENRLCPYIFATVFFSIV